MCVEAYNGGAATTTTGIFALTLPILLQNLCGRKSNRHISEKIVVAWKSGKIGFRARGLSSEKPLLRQSAVVILSAKATRKAYTR